MNDKKFARIEEAYIFTKKYCISKGYDLSKLDELSFSGGFPFGGFHIPSEIEPEGLLNDLDTMPTVIFLVHREKSVSLSIEETDNTKEFFRSN